MLFELDEPEMVKIEEIVLPPKEEESEGKTVKQTIYIFPPEWAGTFGQPITSIAQVGILQQEHYSGNWDVLRPATEIEEMLIGGFVIFMIPQVVGSVIVLLELAAVMLRQAWYI